MPLQPQLMGIVNITRDSFSDGGRFLQPDSAVAHARALTEQGADIIDLGAASSHPDAEHVSPQQEITRLKPVIAALNGQAVLSVDSDKTDVQRFALAAGVACLNDIHGFADPAFHPELADASCTLVVMHALQSHGPATRDSTPDGDILDAISRFFDSRLKTLENAGIARKRLVIDPGMGLFVGSRAETSLQVLQSLTTLKERFRLPLLVSVSRKSFLRKISGQPLDAIAPATLAAELFAAVHGADIIRTHEPGPLRDALTVWNALTDA